MSPKKFKNLVKGRFMNATRRGTYVKSAPGMGKTRIVEQIAQELSAELKEEVGFKAIHATLLQPEDYSFPIVNKEANTVEFVSSKFLFPFMGTDCPKRGILFIDELSQADAVAMKILANLIQERRIHGQFLKPDWIIVSAGNRTTDRSGANRLLGHLADRLTEIELETSINDWTQYAIGAGVPVELISFLNFRPDLLNAYDSQKEKNPTARSWTEGVAESVKAGELDMEVIKGDVGEGPAAEFLGFLKIQKNAANPDAILLNPTTEKLPPDAQTTYAVQAALLHKMTAGNFDRCMAYVERLSSEFQVLFIKMAAKKKPEVQNTKAFIAWNALNAELMS